MKKNTLSQQDREFLRRRELKQFRRERRKRRENRVANYQKNRQKNVVKPKRQPYRISLNVPTIFSIKDNTDEMLKFFNQVNLYLSKSNAVYFNMQDIERMNTDAILYMLSMFDLYQKEHQAYLISGNVPKNDKCNRILVESGFYKYVETKYSNESASSDVLTIESGQLILGDVAEKVSMFTRKKLDIKSIKETNEVYETIIECMANTNNHAYKEARDYKKWWIFASYDGVNDLVTFTFLDNGYGIPSTINRKFFKDMLKPDGELIVSALKGELRTQTKKAYRGKGLPSIFNNAKNGKIKNLRVISKTGYVSSVGSEVKITKLSKPFRGTLLSWDFCNTNVQHIV